jgi:hypothetical protein
MIFTFHFLQEVAEVVGELLLRRRRRRKKRLRRLLRLLTCSVAAMVVTTKQNEKYKMYNDKFICMKCS